jgi:hypothetical protein
MPKLFLIFFLSLLAAVPACLGYFGILLALRPLLRKIRPPSAKLFLDFYVGVIK